MSNWTVIGYFENNGQSVLHHVEADNGMQAFFALAQDEPELTMVAALPGHLTEAEGDVIFPGEGVVDAATVLGQPDVFGPGNDD